MNNQCEECQVRPGEEDLRRQQGILGEVLEQFPVTLTVEELVRTQAVQRLGDQKAEPWEQAIIELRRDGLLRLNGDVVEPTLAAIRANELLDLVTI
ncbi:MAG TPA: hypothetical protein VFY48_11710 [Solirubrobacterales bacterium]|nr:hypothetical protein [Solirubrobacterales bacterium]